MKVDVLNPEDPRWSDWLRTISHDIYHLPGYARMTALKDVEEPIAFLVHDKSYQCLIPLIRRPLPPSTNLSNEFFDAISPYGYPGPISCPGVDAKWWNEALDAFLDEAYRARILAAFVRWSPLFSVAERCPVARETYSCRGETVYVNLEESEEEWDRQTRSGHRYEVRRLSRLGFSVQWNNWALYDQFIEVYQAAMKRLQASDFYSFPRQYFYDLRAMLAGKLHLGCVISPTGALTSGSLFTECSGIVQYHLSATVEEFQKLSPSKLLLHFARQWGKERGNTILHLGGGVGGSRDLLFQFKAGFSQHRGTFHTSNFVLDDALYAEAVGNSGLPLTSQFFPAYRAA